MGDEKRQRGRTIKKKKRCTVRAGRKVSPGSITQRATRANRHSEKTGIEGFECFCHRGMVSV